MIDAKGLWRKRAIIFWSSIFPYLRYVISSGLAIFLFVFTIISIHYYAELLQQLPERFPVNWIAVFCLLPALAFNPIRTYLKRADIIFLLPAEFKLKAYFGQAMSFSLIMQSVIVAFVWLVIWPLYRVSEGANPGLLVLILVLLFVIKWTSLLGHWQELQLQERSHRTSYVLLRWLMTGALLYILFTFNPFKAAIVIALSLLAYIASLRLSAKFAINWDHLIAVEEQQHAKYYSFLSWFVDTPQYQSKIHSRPLLSRLTNLLDFKQKNTYRFLYLKTFLRTDVYSVVLRLTLIGIAIVYLLENDILKGALFVLFGYIIGVQLSALEQHHRYSFWLQIYPLRREERINSVTAVIVRLHLIIYVLLYGAVLLSMGTEPTVLYVLAIGAVCFVAQYLRLKSSLKRKNMRR